MIRAAFLLSAALAFPANAQVVSPLEQPAAVDTSNLATRSEVTAVQAQASAAQAAATAAAQTAAAACTPMAAVPPVETPGGSAGTGNACRLANAANNRISRTGVFTVGAGGAILCSGSTTCSWDVPLPAGSASYPVFFTAIGATAAPGVKCKVTSSTNTGFTGAQCVQSVATVSLLGASVELAATTGTQVFILSLPATQANR